MDTAVAFLVLSKLYRKKRLILGSVLLIMAVAVVGFKDCAILQLLNHVA
jgi:hypothetical protein